ncbi:MULTISPECIES: hypothetical protein [Bacillaceae]|uniref:Uncharacterized protein n=1 Tax=Peribacillus simplex TaxID=1478 RepID=A0A8B5XV61_9BACI|nr:MULTISPECIES: hypothetical protein [Bacillaceae]TVX78515.1 hypothetical protein FQP34_18330 [Peribacillus simplex]
MPWVGTVNKHRAGSIRIRLIRYAQNRLAAAADDFFRIGMGSKIAFIFLGLIFPILVNTVTGCERSMPI